MPPLFQKSETCTLLDQDGRAEIVSAAKARRAALGRGRVVLAVQRHEAAEATPDSGHSPPAGATRLVYQWERDGRWQATAWAETGAPLRDVVSDGVWIEAGDRRWPCRDFEPTANDRDDGLEEEPANTATGALNPDVARAFHAVSWPKHLAVEHLDLDSPLADDGALHLPRLYRDTASNTIVWPYTEYLDTDEFPTPSLWQWIRWQCTRLIHGGVTFEAFFHIPPPQLTGEALFEYHGTHLYALAQAYRFDKSPGGTLDSGARRWRDPFQLEDEVWLPRVCDHFNGPRDDTPAYSTALIPGECHVGTTAVIDIRAVDRDKAVAEDCGTR